MNKASCVIFPIGFPIPAIKWFRNGTDVSNAMKYDIGRDKSGRCTFAIPVVFPEDAGVFTCYATNGTGEAESSAELLVNSKSYNGTFKLGYAIIRT